MMNFYLEKLKNFIFYDKYYFVSLIFLIILTFIFYLNFSEERKQKIYKILFVLLIIAFIFWSFYLSLAQYYVWKNHPISRYLVQNKNYFVSYVYFHFWRDWLYRLLGALILILTMKLINFIFKRDVFYDDEKTLIPFLSLFFFFPYNILFLILGFFVLSLKIGIKILKEKNFVSERFSFKNYWLILAWMIFILAPFIFSNTELLKYKP